MMLNKANVWDMNSSSTVPRRRRFVSATSEARYTEINFGVAQAHLLFQVCPTGSECTRTMTPTSHMACRYVKLRLLKFEPYRTIEPFHGLKRRRDMSLISGHSVEISAKGNQGLAKRHTCLCRVSSGPEQKRMKMDLLNIPNAHGIKNGDKFLVLP